MAGGGYRRAEKWSKNGPKMMSKSLHVSVHIDISPPSTSFFSGAGTCCAMSK